MLEEIERARRHSSAHAQGQLVDACAGKSALAILALALLDANAPHSMRAVAIERDERHRERALRAAELLGVAVRFQYVVADVAGIANVANEANVANAPLASNARSDASPAHFAWPRDAIVVALHACGAASDAVIDAAVACDARTILLVPCCYAGGPRHDRSDVPVPAQELADAWRRRVPLPEHGLVGRRFAQAIIDAERTLRLEASGYETEVVEIFAPTVSPYHLLWRARRVNEPVRMERARVKLAALASGDGTA
jgi:predicted RNA methylase